MMIAVPHKIFFYPCDIRRIPDFQNMSASSLYRMYNRAKDYHGKQSFQYLTVREFAFFLGLDEEYFRAVTQLQ